MFKKENGGAGPPCLPIILSLSTLSPVIPSFPKSHLPQLVFMSLGSECIGWWSGKGREKPILAERDCEEMEDHGDGGDGRHAHGDLGAMRR